MASDKLLQEAKQELGITEPVVTHRVTGNHIEIWLQGGDGEPVVYKRKRPPKRPADFRIIPGVGPVANEALHGAGIRTWMSLRRASEKKLRVVTNVRVMASIVDYLRKE